jgi:Bacteriophage clamp loader A subunit
MTDLFKEIIPSILTGNKDILEDEKDYVPFIVNKALSFHYDCVLQANQMNMSSGLDNRLQYHYLLNTIRSYKRPFQKWQKRETVEDLEVIKEYFNYSNEKAKEALSVLTNDQINEIRTITDKGGLNAKSKRTYRGDTEKS